MIVHVRLVALLLAVSSAAATAATLDPVADAREAALFGDTIAWDIVEGLTTEVGPRLAGTPAEARARSWAVAKLIALGFSNVHVEPFTMPIWQRGVETAAVVAPASQPLAVTALGNSVPTPLAGVTAEVVGFDGLAALVAAPAEAVRGRIVFVDHHFTAQQDASAYVELSAIRRQGPSIASQKGAIAIVIRSIGSDHHRLPHTGVQNWAEGASPIPAGALSMPDAEQLARLLRRAPVTMHLVLTGHPAGIGTSGNVVADVPGSDPDAGIILIGGHLDSWDLGTGAIDDAAGLGIVTAAAKRIMASGRPRRAIRLVWFGAEEPGGLGGAAYAKDHAGDRYVLAAESDTGGDRAWRHVLSAADPDGALARRIGVALAPLGITKGNGQAHGGTDIDPIAERQGIPIIDLDQDATRYFDIHHTADDTLDKVDPGQLRQNVAAWTTMLAIAAEDPEIFGALPPGALRHH